MAQLDLTLAELERLVGGRVVGDPAFRCRSVASLDAAGPDQLSFVRDPKWEAAGRSSRAGALLVGAEIEGFRGHQLVVGEPALAFGKILSRISREMRRQPTGVDPRAVVDESAELGSEVTVGAGAVVAPGASIGDRTVVYANAYVGARSRIGADCELHPNVVLMEEVSLGDRVRVFGGTVIGAEGYGYVAHEGRQVRVPQVGTVTIGDDVEIGALATIDRATLDATTVGRGAKIGDLCHVGHNCRVGEDVLLLPTVTLSGSTTVGDGAVLAGRAGTSDNVSIGAGAVLGGTSVAYRDVPAGAQMWGNPAREKGLQMRIEALLAKLPEMRRELRSLRRAGEEPDDG